jgi:hypothetical protein
MSNKKAAATDKPEDAWNLVLRSALALPGVRVNREDFLRKQLSKHISEKKLKQAIATTPSKAGITHQTIRQLASASIKWHRAGVSAVSFASGLPGGWWLVATAPADLTQFFWHILVVLQKLAYLYGWPDFFADDEASQKAELDDGTLHFLTIFIGVMMGAEAATKTLSDLAERFAAQVLKRLPQEALTKWGLFRVAREIAKWIGIKLTKESFARYLSKSIPILGGLVSGTITWISFTSMSNRLAVHLESLPLAGEDDN